MRKFAIIAVSLGLILLNALSAAFADAGKFGVIVGGKGQVPNIIETLQDLGVSWVRLNCHLDGSNPDFTRFLDAGINLIITFNNTNPNNIDTSYGSLSEFSHAGFPFSSKEAYQQDIKQVLGPLLPYLSKGRKIMAQCENEIIDASISRKARYWRGTTDQYLVQLQAFYEAVHSVNSSIPVVLTSFASETLSVAISHNSNNPRYNFATKFIKRLLSEGKYDAADLHFYGCVDQIPDKVNWIKQNMPSGKIWISTENGGPDSRCPATPLSYSENPTRYEEIEAQQVPQRLSSCAENGASVCLWFSLIDLRGEVSVFSHMGLLGLSIPEGGRQGFQGIKGSFGGARRGQLTPEQGQKLSKLIYKKPAYAAFKSFVAGNR